MSGVLRHLRRAALLSVGDGPSDAQLLESFLARRDEAAFEALLRRHGPMVLGVCRRVLRNAHDAEDAFQATFLVLSRRAGSIRSKQVVASWLYGVAYRTARKARAMNAKRRAKERQAGATPRSESTADGAQEELLAQLDYELSRLPEKYRVPVVLCELEGKHRKEAARLLGVPEGTLSWRLAQAKKRLARRLSLYGSVAVAALLAEEAASACLTPTLRASTVKAVLTVGKVPAEVLALTEGVMKAMLLTKLKITACFAMLMLLAGVGATGLTYRATAQEPKREVGYQAPLASRPQADDLESLRLEIDALRKELRATRERVKVLEGEMRAMKENPGGTGRTTTGRMMNMKGAVGGPGSGGVGRGVGQGNGGPGVGGPGSGIGGPGGTGNFGPGKRLEAPSDPVSDAENALKRLRQDPTDQKAAEELELALKLLKKREKPRPPAEENLKGAQ
jgi:RNA polymerase sigma factor (sigma-70 family)